MTTKHQGECTASSIFRVTGFSGAGNILIWYFTNANAHFLLPTSSGDAAAVREIKVSHPQSVGGESGSDCSMLRKRRGRDVRKLRGMPNGSLWRTLTHAPREQLPKSANINHFAAKKWTESGISSRG